MILLFFSFIVISYSNEHRTDNTRVTADSTWLRHCVCDSQDNCNIKCPTGYTRQSVSTFLSGMTSYLTGGYPEYLDIFIVSAIPDTFNIDISKSGLINTTITNINENSVPYILIKNTASTIKKISFSKIKVNVMINQLGSNDITFDSGSTMVLDCSITKLEVGSDRVKITKYTTILDEAIVMIKDSTIEDINRWNDGITYLTVMSGIWGYTESGTEKISGNKVVITAGKAGCDAYIDTMETEEEYNLISINTQDFDMKVATTVQRGTKFPDISASPKGATFSVVPRRPIERNVFPIDYMGCHYYRIPAIGTAKDGTLIAVVDARWTNAKDLPNNISIMVRRSFDNGCSWTDPDIITDIKNAKGFGDASIVTDRKTGRIFILYNGINGFLQSTVTNPIRLFFCHSDDNGKTWVNHIEFTHQIYSNLCTYCDDFAKNKLLGIFLTSGASLQLRDGRLMVAAVSRTTTGTSQTQNYAIYSDDLGETWHLGANKSNDGANEAKFIEKDNGTVVIVVRQRGNRKFVFSDDRGDSWYNPTEMVDIIDPGCDGDVIKYTSTADGFDKNRWIITIPYFKSIRKNVSVLLSYDEGVTWPVKKVIDKGYSGYSSVTVDKNGHMHILYEKNQDYESEVGLFHMPIAEFTLEWLTDGKDTYTKPTRINWCVCDNKEECEKCANIGHFQFNHKIFDNYIDSYTEYLPSMKYEIVSEKTRSFSIDLERVGLNDEGGDFSSSVLRNTKSDNERKVPTVYLKGIPKMTKKLYFTRIPVHIEDFDQINNAFLEVFKITDGRILLSDIYFQKIEIGKTRIKLTKRGNDSQTKEIDFTGEIFINNTQKDLEIHSGIDENVNEETSYNKVFVTSEGNTNLHFSGKWKNTTSISPLIYHYQKSGVSEMKWDSYYKGLTNFTVCFPCGDENDGDENGGECAKKENDGNTVSFTIFIATVGALAVVIIILSSVLIYLFAKRTMKDENSSIAKKALSQSLYC